MRLFFRPMPWLTLITAVMLAILISLGTWQYQRLQWKTQLLAEIDQAAEADPFTSLREVEIALDAGEPVDFRRIAFAGDVLEQYQPFLVFTPAERTQAWRPFYAVSDETQTVFVAMKPIPDSQRESTLRTLEALDTVQSLAFAGYVRLHRMPGKFAPVSTPSANRWFSFNPMPDTDNWGDRISGGIITDFYIDAVPGGADMAPLPPKRPDIRNNHLDYMLTWYSFALILLVIYFMLHYRRERFGFK